MCMCVIHITSKRSFYERKYKNNGARFFTISSFSLGRETHSRTHTHAHTHLDAHKDIENFRSFSSARTNFIIITKQTLPLRFMCLYDVLGNKSKKKNCSTFWFFFSLVILRFFLLCICSLLFFLLLLLFSRLSFYLPLTSWTNDVD